MSENKVVTVSGPSIPILGLLGVVFVTLKLLGKITWSWWLVTLPFWGPAVIGLAIMTGVLLVVGLFYLLDDKKKR